MDSPEILLRDLNRALRELHGAAHLLRDEHIDSELLIPIRRLLLAEVLGNTRIIAIGGAQGAGKTTLLRSLYSLEIGNSNWLQPNEGRGEKFPVLVLEEPARQDVQGTLRKLCKSAESAKYYLDDVPVDVEEFQKALSNPEPEILLPVLKVPSRYFTGENQAWLLLPGYEPQDRENRHWQELMRQALIAATGCIIVTDETRLADKLQIEIVNDMLANELAGAQPLVVISKTEYARRDPKRINALRNTAREVFRASDCWVVCTGSADKNYIDEWLPILQQGIEELALTGGKNRKAQIGKLEEVLAKDLTRALVSIQSKSQLFFRQRHVEGEANEVVQGCLEAFDQEKDSLREEYQRGVSEFLDQSFAQAWIRLQARLIDNHEGLLNGAVKIFDKASESHQKIELDVKNSWGAVGDVLQEYQKVLGGITKKKLGAPNKGEGLDRSGDSLIRLGHADAHVECISWDRPNEDDQKNLECIFLGKQDLNKHYERTIKILPALTLEYARVATLFPGVVGVQSENWELAPVDSRSDMINRAVVQLKDSVTLGQNVLRFIAAILAVDILADGNADLIGGGLNTLNPGSAGGAVAISGIGSAIIGSVAIGYLTVSALKAVRTHDEKARVAAHSMLVTVKEHYQRHFLHSFDSMMDQTRAHLRQSLRERYHLDESLMEQDRLAKAIADTRVLQRDLLDELRRSGKSIPLF